MKITVTIARQLGSGGSEVGERLAQALGVRCLDREIVSRTARHLDLSEQEVAAREERVASFWERMLTGFAGVSAPEAAYIPEPLQTLSDRQIFENETAVMQAIARQENCVIVGRAAAHVLEPHPGLINLFLHAPLSFRVPRVMKLYGAQTEAQARALIEKSDGARQRSIAQMTGRQWAEASSYHLCVDSSVLPLAEISELLTQFVQRRIAATG